MDNIGQLIKQISNKLISDLNYNLKEFDLTVSQVQVMLVVKDNDNKVCQKVIADELHIKHSSLIDVLKVLERKGFINRYNSENNAKYTEVSLTNAGINVLSKLDINVDKTQEMMASTLGFRSVKEMIDKFKMILDNLDNKYY